MTTMNKYGVDKARYYMYLKRTCKYNVSKNNKLNNILH